MGLGGFNVDDPYTQFNTWQTVMNGVNTATMFAAVVLNSGLFYVILAEPKLRAQDSLGLFVNMVVVDFLVGLGNGVIHLLNAIGGGWTTGQVGCAVSSFSRSVRALSFFAVVWLCFVCTTNHTTSQSPSCVSPSVSGSAVSRCGVWR
jgi:hypothetical protein